MLRGVGQVFSALGCLVAAVIAPGVGGVLLLIDAHRTGDPHNLGVLLLVLAAVGLALTITARVRGPNPWYLAADREVCGGTTNDFTTLARLADEVDVQCRALELTRLSDFVSSVGRNAQLHRPADVLVTVQLLKAHVDDLPLAPRQAPLRAALRDELSRLTTALTASEAASASVCFVATRVWSGLIETNLKIFLVRS